MSKTTIKENADKESNTENFDFIDMFDTLVEDSENCVLTDEQKAHNKILVESGALVYCEDEKND